MKKQVITFLLAVVVILALAACGSDSSSASSKTVVAAPQKETVAPVVELASSGSLGSYSVEIGECELCQDYSGNPALLVNFTFTNNSDDNASAMIALNYDAYQNGVELDYAIIVDDSVYSSDDLMKEIQPGASISVKAAYVLTSKTAPVEFEICEAFSFDDSALGKTFEISDGGVTELSVAPGADTAEQIDDYTISIVSYEFAEDYQGNQALIVTYGFSNTSDDTTNFLFALTAKAFQDGIELETAFINDDTLVDSGSSMRNVRPGAGLAVTEAYLLTSSTSPVQIEVEESFSFDDAKIVTEIDITK